MNDRFKFRAWDKETKHMIDVYDLGMTMKNHIGFKATCIDSDDVLMPKHPYLSHKRFANVIIMQCTGVKDKNGTLVYEGDIIQHTYYNSEIEEYEQAKCIVEYKENEYDYNGRCYGFDINGYWQKNFEIIGNIYENPELIGGD